MTVSTLPVKLTNSVVPYAIAIDAHSSSGIWESIVPAMDLMQAPPSTPSETFIINSTNIYFSGALMDVAFFAPLSRAQVLGHFSAQHCDYGPQSLSVCHTIEGIRGSPSPCEMCLWHKCLGETAPSGVDCSPVECQQGTVPSANGTCNTLGKDSFLTKIDNSTP